MPTLTGLLREAVSHMTMGIPIMGMGMVTMATAMEGMATEGMGIATVMVMDIPMAHQGEAWMPTWEVMKRLGKKLYDWG